MPPDAVAPDLAAALLRAGYRVAGPVGIGAGGPAWAAVGREDGPVAGARVVVTELTVPAGPRGDLVRGRLRDLRAVSHEHLADIVGVVPLVGSGAQDPDADGGDPVAPLAAGRWAVLLAEVPGPNLAALLAARPPLSEGEAVTLTVPLAEALASLHDAGLVHGDVSPANVVVRPDGRPVLVDLLGAVTGDARARGRGTPGFAAPEVARGAAPGPAADVHALARVALAALAGGSGPGLRAVLERACAADPTDRPSAPELAARCFDAAAALPLVVPDAAVLARTTLARLAVEPHARSALTVRPSGSRHRAGGGPRRAVARLGAAAVAAVALTVCGLVVGGLTPGGGPDAPAGAPAAASRVDPGAGSGGPGSRPSDPLAAAVALTERRAQVLVAGDPAGLDEVDLVGGGAHDADVALLARVHRAGQRIEGLAAAVLSARVVGPADTDARRARVEVTSGLSAHRRVPAAGAAATGVEVPAQPARTVVLTLAWTPSGWRVAEVADAPVSDPGG